MDQTLNLPPLLRLSPALRQRIYAYLLLPHPNEHITTINYDLEFPYLQHPSSTTFTPHHLDHCRCPQRQPKPDTKPATHIYTRYVCHNPNVLIRPRSKQHWFLDKPGPAFNILRPPTEEEKEMLPDAGIICVNKQIYKEALPLLYRGRTFRLLTGICSRGRYQAYATLVWLSRLSPLARENISSLSLSCWSCEEDCMNANAERAYEAFVRFCILKMPGLKEVWVSVLSAEGGEVEEEELGEVPLHPLAGLFEKEGIKLYLQEQVKDGEVYVFGDKETFLRYCGEGDGLKEDDRREGNGEAEKHGPRVQGTGGGECGGQGKAENLGDEGDGAEGRGEHEEEEAWVVVDLNPMAEEKSVVG